ncbi:MAG: cell division protein ZapB [Spirochaetaceae bacterium]|nr:cell division protein ZapB [Spirochaetaceae bacterium]
MISVEQVRALEERVEKAIAYIAALRAENGELRRGLEKAEGDLGRAESRAAELEAAAETFRHDQARIEEGIVHALEKLDAFEDLVVRAAEPQLQARELGAPAPRTHVAAPAAVPPAAGPAPIAAAPAAAVAAPASESLPAASPAAEAEARVADELSDEELEAATAPEAPAERPEPAAEEPVQAGVVSPAAKPAQAAPAVPPPNELDIF